jgi:hypothetical protein
MAETSPLKCAFTGVVFLTLLYLAAWGIMELAGVKPIHQLILDEIRKSDFSPIDAQCINQATRKCRNSPIQSRDQCIQRNRNTCLKNVAQYTNTQQIKTMMHNKMPHGLSTSDNRNVFKEGCCGIIG